MADDANDLFIFGDDFEVILEILESDEGLEEQFVAAVSEVQHEVIVCEVCGKKYKTKGGLKRHTSAKHSQNLGGEQQRELTPTILADLVNSSLLKVKNTKVYSASLKKELNLYTFEQLEEGTEEFSKLKTIYEGFVKNGNAEKFYGKYYATVPLNSTRFFKGLSRNAATLLSTKVADCMLAYCKKENSTSEKNKEPSVALSEREKAGLQYVGGYVLHNLHNKHRGSSSTESQQAMAILKAGNLKTSVDSQKLISTLNRGGLWSITEPAEKVFLKTEHYFRAFTSEAGLQNVDIASIIHKSISDCDLLSNYQLMVSAAELTPDSHVSKDVLQSIVNLYVRVRSFSFAKDIYGGRELPIKKLTYFVE